MDNSISFRTEIKINPSSHKFSLSARVLTAGSCFAEVMGNKLATYKLASRVNPFGTIFNPLSLFKLLKAALQPEANFSGQLLERDGLWYAYDLHSSFSAPSPDLLRADIEESLKQTQAFLKEANLLIITLGTAVAYRLKANNILVANCHKVTQQEFIKELIPAEAITQAFSDLYPQLIKFNPNLQILLTVSPVRHLKETLELNSVSKAILRLACHQIQEKYPNVTYFPAYELMLDDLRDYRFYKADMLHPTAVAEAYIWQKFKDAYFDEDFNRFTIAWDKIITALAHKPFHPASVAHQQFLRKTLAKLESWQNTIDCSAEISQVKSQII